MIFGLMFASLTPSLTHTHDMQSQAKSFFLSWCPLLGVCSVIDGAQEKNDLYMGKKLVPSTSYTYLSSMDGEFLEIEELENLKNVKEGWASMRRTIGP